MARTYLYQTDRLPYSLTSLWYRGPPDHVLSCADSRRLSPGRAASKYFNTKAAQEYNIQSLLKLKDSFRHRP